MYFERQKPKKLHRYARAIVLGIITFALMSMFSVRVAVVQIKEHGKYRKDAGYVSSTPVKVKAARGEILDRYGRPIAVNRDGYNIVFTAGDFTKIKRNKIINDLKRMEGNL